MEPSISVRPDSLDDSDTEGIASSSEDEVSLSQSGSGPCWGMARCVAGR